MVSNPKYFILITTPYSDNNNDRYSDDFWSLFEFENTIVSRISRDSRIRSLTFRHQIVQDAGGAAQHEHAGQRHFSGHPFRYQPGQQASRDLDERDQGVVQVLVARDVRRVDRQPVVHER